MENFTPFTIIFGERLRALREKAKLSQDELAKVLGVSRGSISFYEKGERVPNIEFLGAVAGLFDVSYYYLMGDIETYNPVKIDELSGLSNDVINFLRDYAGELFPIEKRIDIFGELLKNKQFQDALRELNIVVQERRWLLRAIARGEQAVENEDNLGAIDKEYFIFKIATKIVKACDEVVDQLAGRTLSKEDWEKIMQHYAKQTAESREAYEKERDELNAFIEGEIETVIRRRIHGLEYSEHNAQSKHDAALDALIHGLEYSEHNKGEQP